MSVISGNVINEPYAEIVAQNLRDTGVCSYIDDDMNQNIIITQERYEALMELLDRALGEMVDAGLRDVEAGRGMPAHEAIDEIRKGAKPPGGRMRRDRYHHEGALSHHDSHRHARRPGRGPSGRFDRGCSPRCGLHPRFVHIPDRRKAGPHGFGAPRGLGDNGPQGGIGRMIILSLSRSACRSRIPPLSRRPEERPRWP